MAPDTQPQVVIDRMSNTVTISAGLAWTKFDEASFMPRTTTTLDIVLPFAGSPFDPAFVAPEIPARDFLVRPEGVGQPPLAVTLPGRASVTVQDPQQIGYPGSGADIERAVDLEYGLFRLELADGRRFWGVEIDDFSSIFPVNQGLDGDQNFSTFIVFDDIFESFNYIYMDLFTETPIGRPVFDIGTAGFFGDSEFEPVRVADLRATPTTGPDMLLGGPENDIFDALEGNDVVETLGGDDRLLLGAGNDIGRGGEGDDVLEGGPGADTLEGGAGSDWAGYNTSAAGVEIDMRANSARGGDAEGDSLSGVENLTATNFTDSIGGDDGANRIYTWWGDDWVWGRNGDDVIDGGGNADRLWGEAGSDTLNGGDGFDFLYGGEDDDALGGDAGNDVVYGGGGNDWLWGGAGSDAFVIDAAALTDGQVDRIMDFQDDGATGIDWVRFVDLRYEQIVWYEQGTSAVMQIVLDQGGSAYIEIMSFDLARLDDQYYFT